MKFMFSLLALVVALLLVLFLAKSQLQELPHPEGAASSAGAGGKSGLITPQQYKKQLEQAMHASQPTDTGGGQP